MVNRHFHRFPAFNAKLIDLYKSKSKPMIDQLYEPMLEWMMNENNIQSTRFSGILKPDSIYN